MFLAVGVVGNMRIYSILKTVLIHFQHTVYGIMCRTLAENDLARISRPIRLHYMFSTSIQSIPVLRPYTSLKYYYFPFEIQFLPFFATTKVRPFGFLTISGQFPLFCTDFF